jgi:glutamine synthetase
MRIELRNPDPACNPYLVLSAILAAGLAGIDGNYKLPDPLDSGVSGETVPCAGEPLPRQLAEAISIFEKSDLMKQTLGETTHRLIIENKQIELDRFSNYITDYEINEYLPIL